MAKARSFWAPSIIPEKKAKGFRFGKLTLYKVQPQGWDKQHQKTKKKKYEIQNKNPEEKFLSM